MSPEQARGENLDARTDLFSLGAVLYEMATGKQPFEGNTAAVVFNAILSHEPVPPSQSNPAIPVRFEELVHKALEKDRNLRYQTAADIHADLRRLKRDTESAQGVRLAGNAAATGITETAPFSGPGSDSRVVTAPVEVLATHRRWPLVVAGVFALLVIAGGTMWFTRGKPEARPEMKLHQLTMNSSDDPVRGGSISPDGKYLAYADRQGIHITVIATGESQILPQPGGLEGSYKEWVIQQWFPDGTRFIINLSPPFELSSANPQGTIWTASVMGGSPRKLRDQGEACSASPDGSLINFATNYGRLGPRDLWVMKPTGEDAHKVYGTGSDLAIHCGPWSPDGQHFLSVTDPGQGQPGQIQVQDLKGGQPRTILSSDKLSEFFWLADGRFIYSREEDSGSCNLWEMRLNSVGEPISKPRRLTNWAGFCINNMSATSDSKRLAFSEPRIHGTVFVTTIENNGARLSPPKQFTLSEGWDIPEAWTPDSKSLIIASNRRGKFGIYKQALCRCVSYWT